MLLSLPLSPDGGLSEVGDDRSELEAEEVELRAEVADEENSDEVVVKVELKNVDDVIELILTFYMQGR